ncbi:MAG: phospholipid scramblase family protein [Myxococcota bacterium]|nr:phospholipid scramblase family protein [Myxococcota bacterium]
MNKPKKTEGDLELDWKGRAPRGSDQPAAPPVEEQQRAGRGRPGDARFMTQAVQLGLEPILSGDSFTVKQLKEWGEILTGWETRNRYEVFNSQGGAFLCVGVGGEGIANLLLRNFWMFRSMQLEFMTYSGTLVMRVTRPFSWFLRRFEVTSWDGRPMGVLQQRFSLLRRVFDVLTPGGVKVATLEGPWYRPWTFLVKRNGVEVAKICKEWSGFGREAFTDADVFGVELSPTLDDPFLRQLVLAATLAIDLSFFEQHGSRRRGSLGIENLFSS